MTLPELRVLAFPETYRIIAADRSPSALIADISEPDDLDAVLAVIAATGVDLADVLGQPALVPREERPTGPGAAWALLAFSMPGRPSRFTDGSYGIWYAAERYETAQAETLFHQARLMRAWGEPPQEVPKQILRAQLSGPAADLRALQQTDPATYATLHDPDPARYGPAQTFGAACRRGGAALIVYHSVRQLAAGVPGQTCVGALRANAVFGVEVCGRVGFRWTGSGVTAGGVEWR